MRMRMRMRWPLRQPTDGRHDRRPAIGLASVIVLLAGCGSSQMGGTSTNSGAVTSGHVTVTISKAHYAPHETVDVTIANGLSSGILAADHQSDCTVLVIEHLTGTNWQQLNPCLLMSPTRLIAFAAGTTTLQQLAPPSGEGATGWPTGTYRIVLTYLQQASGPETTISSAQFTVA